MSSGQMLLVPTRPSSFHSTAGRAAPVALPLPSLVLAPPPAPRKAPAAPRWLARFLVVALALVGPGLAFAGQKSVTLDIDGRVRKVHTYSNDARTLLSRAGV